MSGSKQSEDKQYKYADNPPTKWDLLAFLVHKCKWMEKGYGPILWGLVLDVFFNLFRLGAAAMDGFTHTKTIWGKQVVIGFFNDPSVLTNLIFGWLIFSFHLWLHKGIGQVFDGLVKNGVFSKGTCDDPKKNSMDLEEKEKIDSYLKSAFKSQNSWWRLLFMTAVFILIMSITGKQYVSMGEGAWYTAGKYSRYAAMVWAGLLVGSLTGLLFGFFQLIRHLRKIFVSLDPKILPAHSDGVGGLSPLGTFALRLVYLISLVGIMLLAITPYTRGFATTGVFRYQLSPGLIFAGCFYALVSPVIFFMVLGTASKAMERKKKDALKVSCCRVNQEYAKVKSAVGQPPDGELEKMVRELESAQKFNAIVREFPVWPFDQSSIRKFTTSYLAPVIVGLFVEVIVKLLGLAK